MAYGSFADVADFEGDLRSTLTSSQTVRQRRGRFTSAASWRILGLQVYRAMNVPHPDGLDFMWFLNVGIVMSLGFLGTWCYFGVFLYSQFLWLMEECPLKGKFIQMTISLFHPDLISDLSRIFLPPSEYNVGEWNLGYPQLWKNITNVSLQESYHCES